MSMTPDSHREAFLAFFEERGHTRHPSDRLVPEHDPTLLFTGAGMNQFKAMFLGKGNLPFRRATTSQKCLRMPDLDNVGRTASHHTFFEMLGNFSFGDYFKGEAIAWAWELLGQLGIPADRLSVTVYEDDDEAVALWADEVGVPRERIFRCGEEDNFWPASAPSKGPNGICGPCSEIYFDFAPEQGAFPAGGPPEDGKRFVEVWNLVFTQFDRQPDGTLAPLPQKNIDTGLGFERLVRVLESLAAGRVLESNFETSLFAPIMAAIHAHVGRPTRFGTPDGARTRRMADHVRAAVFCIGDDVRPSNEKQGYVVRKLLRRAMIDRHVLGGDLRRPWLCELAGTVIEAMGVAYPSLREGRSVITASVAAEEEKFAGSFLAASQKLSVLASEAREAGQPMLAGRHAFLLYDTFGLPLDMQRMLVEEQGLAIDEEGYRTCMAEQRRQSRAQSVISEDIFDDGPLAVVGDSLPVTEYVRRTLDVEARILAVVEEEGLDGGDDSAWIVVLDRTPFYAESGGQVGDAGEIRGEAFSLEVDDARLLRGIVLHRGVAAHGRPVPGPCQARVDVVRRAATARNHTATHLLHASLRSILGEDVTQAGSLVAPDRLRFDFRFPRALTEDELCAVEDRVNAWILANQVLACAEMGREDARREGAMALFGEKYGEIVRVVRVPGLEGGDDSVELCGGTHVARSGDIGLLRITYEGSIAAGIRRVEACTGLGVLGLVRQEHSLLREAASQVKTSPDRLPERLAALQTEFKTARVALSELQARLAEEALGSSLRQVGTLQVAVAVIEGLPVGTLRERAARFVRSRGDLAVLGSADEDGTAFLVAANPQACGRGLGADRLVKALAVALNGKGGGKPGLAQGRGGPAEDLQGVLEDVLDRCAAAPQ